MPRVAELEVAGQLREAGFEMGERLGLGAYTAVYRASREGRRYAVKVLRDGAGGEAVLRAFRREAAMLASVRHPGLPEVYEVGLAGTRPYLVMELLEGRSLRAMLEAGPLEVAATVTLASQVAEALAAAHRAGLVHRDVKPDNIVFGTDGRARLIDFGLAQAAGGQDPELVVGTVRYAAPEQTGMLKRPVDHRSDLYALGVVSFECLTGQPPFVSHDAGELVRLNAVAVPPPIEELRGDVPPALAWLVAKLLAKDPDDRYQTAVGLTADLARLATGEWSFTLAVDDDPLASAAEGSLVGRERELATLKRCWERARQGDGGMVVVQGAPGGGKSRLVRELLRSVHAGGQPVLAGKCSPDDPLPLAPVREAIESYLRELAQAGPGGSAGLARVRQAAEQAAGLLAGLSPTLADVLDQTPLETDADQHEQFVAAVVEFLVELARQVGGMVVCLDDLQWLDQASLHVLQRLIPQLASAPLLVACTARDGGQGTAVLGDLRAGWRGASLAEVRLAPLDEAGVAELIGAQLGMKADPELARRLAVRSGGNPLAVMEYIRVTLDAGLIRPAWGRWEVDLGALDRLDLPRDVLALILGRVDALGPGRRALLAAAATIGLRFQLGLLARVCEVSDEQALAAATEAAGQRLVEAVGGDEYGFVHDRVREALLGGLDTAELRRLHQRIAEAMEAAAAGDDPRRVYELARHYALGEVDRTPERAFRAGWSAGQAALTDHAAADAVGFLEVAEQAAQRAGIDPGGAFQAMLGAALHAAGRLDEAAARFERALRVEQDPLRRGALLAALARVDYGRPDYTAASRRSLQGLAEIGLPLPRSRLLRLLSSVVAILRGLASQHPRLGYGRARGRDRERLVLSLRLTEIAGRAAYHSLPRPILLLSALGTLHAANRVGPCPEYVATYTTTAEATASVGLRRVALWALERAQRAAEQLGSPRLLARVSLARAYLHELLGQPLLFERALPRVLNERGHWLTNELYLEACMALASMLELRGCSRQADEWRRRGVEHGLSYPTILTTPAVLGDGEEAEAQLKRARELLERRTELRSRTLRGAIYYAAGWVHLERGELGEPFDELLAAHHRHGPSVHAVAHFWCWFWLLQAYGRLAQAHAAAGADRPARLEAAQRAVADLGTLARRAPVPRAHHLVAQAGLALLVKDHGRALDLLGRAERVAEELEAPWVRFEAACVRARLLSERGQEPAAGWQARLALSLAERHGWVYRAARVRREFPLEESTSTSTHGSHQARTNSAEGLRDRRQLEALLEVGVAAANVLEPRELARVALDEILRILGAERAFLFTCSSEHAPLERYAGRDADGNDLDELLGYSSTVVERARAGRRALIVTGTDHGAALGSESAVVHGLRSIMVAPLQLEGRLLGMVYLDSRIAKGVFAPTDADILVAIAQHVAVSLETARAAQLEVQVEAERRQRGLAEALRDATLELSRTLDPVEVAERTLAAAAAQVGADSGCVLLRDDVGFGLVARYGTLTAAAARGTYLPEDATSGLDALLTQPQPIVGGATPAAGRQGLGLPNGLAEVLGPAGSWLAVPLPAAGERPACLVLLATAKPGAYGRAQAGMAEAFLAQGAIAYDNARLFRKVEELATTDGLTSVANRRHFMELAGQKLAAAQRHGLALAALMLDLDHFKQVNDTYGHATGDQVIRAVAQRLAAMIRQDDLLGRYGGEEFALLVHDAAGVAELAERLRAAVATDPIPTDDGPLPVTVSIGVATLEASDTAADAILARADAALYQAKRAGRNRVATTHS
jgi:eukaryotic-like serine/threonine-protein kinase